MTEKQKKIRHLSQPKTAAEWIYRLRFTIASASVRTVLAFSGNADRCRFGSCVLLGCRRQKFLRLGMPDESRD